MKYPCELVVEANGSWEVVREFDSLDQGLAYIRDRFPQGHARWRRTWGGWALPIYEGYLDNVAHAYSVYALRVTEEVFLQMATKGWA